MVQGDEINPRIMRWARETAGLSVKEAAGKLGLKDTAKGTAVEKLKALEEGRRDPGQTILDKAAALYRRPLIAFYMSEPPVRGDRGEDFRSVEAASPRDNANLDAKMYSAVLPRAAHLRLVGQTLPYRCTRLDGTPTGWADSNIGIILLVGVAPIPKALNG
jgi:transcriptional regulator with XRE-family HTH domain